MRITRITVRNVMGIEELDLQDLGAMTVVKADNGVGKSSLIEAIKAAVGGGKDATLLRNGAERGEVVLVFEDGHTLTQPIGPGDPVARDPNKKKINYGQFRASMFDAFVFNPIRFLLAEQKQQTAIMLEQLDILVTREELAAIDIQCDPDILKLHGLEALAAIHNSIYDTRTGVNVAAKDKRATVKQLRDALLPEGEDVAARIDAVRQQIASIDGDLSAKHGTVKALLESANTTARADAEKEKSALQADAQAKITELDKQIAAIRAQLAADIAAADHRMTALITENRTLANEEYEKFKAGKGANREGLAAELARLKQVEETAIKNQRSREMMEQMEAEATEQEEESKRLTARLKGLERLRQEKTKALPLSGVDIRDGVIYVDVDTNPPGVPLHRANEAKRVAFALRLAKHRAQARGVKVPFAVIDGINFLSPRMTESFLAAAPASGLQFVVTQVTEDQQLTVERRA